VNYKYSGAILSVDELHENLNDPNLRIFDCTFYLHYEPGTGQPYRVESGRADYEAGHIPNAGFLDLQEEFSVVDSPYRFTLLSMEATAKAFANRGVDEKCKVILYSRENMQRATRFWWMLRWIGFDNVAVLDGGMDKWLADSLPVSTRACVYPTGRIEVKPRPTLFCDHHEVLNSIGQAGTCTLNALTPDLHSGADSRYGRAGHVPGSRNVPVASLLDPVTQEFLPSEDAARVFESVGATPDKKIIVYCGGGIAATLDAFVLYQLGYKNITVYDDSMSQWAVDKSLPIATN